VIKVEPPAGDVWHSWGPVMMTPASDEENPLWDIVNAHKRGIAVDLKHPEGRKIMQALLAKADVFLTNTRADSLREMQLDYESLKEKYPGLIFALVTGYGEAGPDSDRPGFDVVSFWARSGFMVDLVKPDEYPLYSPAGFGDLSVGTALFGGICAALFNRQRTGQGDKIAISLYGTAIWLSGVMITTAQERYGNVFPKARGEGNPIAVPYRCKDGEWVIIAVLNYEKHWPVFCKALGREDLAADPRFKTRQAMHQHKKELIRILEDVFTAKESAEWIELLTRADIVHERLRHFREVTRDAQALENNFVSEITVGGGQKAVLPNTPLKFERHQVRPPQRGPWLGEHTREVLEELGYPAEQIAEMKKSKVIVMR
jgi:crotonobetainyl-CoA:carnitine CoA-transferase CaiB-like acyl-CoA transferase